MTVSSGTDLKVGFALGIDGSFSIVIWNGRGYIKWNSCGGQENDI